jgi:hypothetical protein
MQTWMKCRTSKSIISMRARFLRCINRKDRPPFETSQAELLIDSYKYDSHQCRTDHEKLEIEIDDFVENLGKTRKKYLPLLKSDEERNSKDYYHSVKCHP